MTSTPPHLHGSGLASAVGSHAASGLAAMAAGVARLTPLDPPTPIGDPVIIARAPGHLPLSANPDRRVLGLLVDAVDDLNSSAPPPVDANLAVFVGWPDPHRPGAPSRPTPELLADVLGSRVGSPLPPDRVQCLTGETSGARALVLATRTMANDDDLDACLIAAADSWLTADALRWLAMSCPLRQWPAGSGMAPGEAGAAVWLVRQSPMSSTPRVLGSAVAQVETTASGSFPLGLAIEGALVSAVLPLHAIEHAVIDAGSDGWGQAEYEVVMARLAREPWHGRVWRPAESIGHVGAAAGIIAALQGAHVLQRHGDGGMALCIVSGHRCPRVAMVVGAQPRAAISASEEIEWSL